MPTKVPTKKPKNLKKRNIMRKTSAGSQAKQISALSTQVARLTKENYAKVRTSWERQTLSCQPAVLSGTNPYILPLPCAIGDPLGTGSNAAGVAMKWSDNLGLAAQPTFSKRLVFDYPEAARYSNVAYHTGGEMKYQFLNSEPSMSRLTMFIVKPKRIYADQLVVDRGLKAVSGVSGSAAGAGAFLIKDQDFIVHTSDGTSGTFFGAEMNSKYFTTLAKRNITFSHPGSTSLQTTAQANNTNPGNNALIATGTIRWKGLGKQKNAEWRHNLGGGDPDVVQKGQSVMENGYLDDKNENLVMCVIVSNGVSGDNQQIKFGCVCTDYYRVQV